MYVCDYVNEGVTVKLALSVRMVWLNSYVAGIVTEKVCRVIMFIILEQNSYQIIIV